MQSWHAVESLRWVGVVSLSVILLFGILPILKAANDPSQSASQTWAFDEWGHRLISIILTVFGAGFCAFLIGWLIPIYHLWVGMYSITLAGYLAILGIAWFPMVNNPGEHSVWHPHFIGGVAAACGAIIGYSAILLATPDIPRLSYYITVVALLYSAAWPAFFLRSFRRYFKPLEGILVVLFVTVIASLTIGW
jgi:hypothetical protein